MGIYCSACGQTKKGSAIPVKCPFCGNRDLTKFTRAPDPAIATADPVLRMEM